LFQKAVYDDFRCINSYLRSKQAEIETNDKVLAFQQGKPKIINLSKYLAQRT